MRLTPSDIVSKLKGTSGWHIAFVVLCLVVTIFLALRASDEYRWSDWGFGDAQSMLSLKQWNEEGWLRNYLLFIPQGYANVVRYLDDPQLRHHAHGTCPGSAPGVGPRLWYTHYPPGYLVPYAVLFKVGIDGIFPARMLSVIFSMAAVVLMYALFVKLTRPEVAFFACLFYVFSPVFLGYADTIANQPLDDMLRFGFMLAVVLSTRSSDLTARNRWSIAAWVMEFALSLSSFDSVFFIYTWLVGWDLLDRQGFRWKRYLVYSIAPISAHSLQFLQNVWYLGWDTAVLDIKVTFMQKAGSVSNYGNVSGGRGALIVNALMGVIHSAYQSQFLIIPLIALYVCFILLVQGRERDGFPSLQLFAVLFLCGLAYIVALPHGAKMPYQGRQMAPFVALLSAASTWSLIVVFGSLIKGKLSVYGDSTGFMSNFRLVYILPAGVLLGLFWFNFAAQDRFPMYALPESAVAQGASERFYPPAYALKEDILVAKQLHNLKPKYDQVFFDIDGFQSYWDPNYVPGYPQINPIVEFYAGSKPVLCFRTPAAIADDIEYLVRNKKTFFSPVLISTKLALLEEVIVLLNERGIMNAMPSSINETMGRNVIDLTELINWEKK